MMEKRKIILYICMSLDGFIATEDDDISWLDIVDKEGEDYGYHAFVTNVDTYIVGRKSYQKVLDMIGEFPQTKDFDCYILSRQNLPPKEGLTFYNGDIVALIEELRSQEGKNIYCDGGAEVVKLFMEYDLIDEYIVSVIPYILGSGKRLFIGGTESMAIRLVNQRSFDTGLVQLHYQRVRK